MWANLEHKMAGGGAWKLNNSAHYEGKAIKKTKV